MLAEATSTTVFQHQTLQYSLEILLNSRAGDQLLKHELAGNIPKNNKLSYIRKYLGSTPRLPVKRNRLCLGCLIQMLKGVESKKPKHPHRQTLQAKTLSTYTTQSSIPSCVICKRTGHGLTKCRKFKIVSSLCMQRSFALDV